MQKLRKLNIFQIYRKLPLIVFKSAYLIPQNPYFNYKTKVPKNDVLTIRKQRAA
jgi:hypothetical protein